MSFVRTTLQLYSRHARKIQLIHYRTTSTLNPIPDRLLKENLKSADYPHKSAIISKNPEIRTSILSSDPLKIINVPEVSVRTIPDAFHRGLKVSKEDGHCLVTLKGDHKEYTTYKQVREIVTHLSSAILKLNLKPDSSSFVAIHAKNGKEQTLALLGCAFASCPVVPLYDKVGTENLNHILEEAEIELMFCDTPQKVEHVLNNKTFNIKHLVVTEKCSGDLVTRAEQKGIKVWHIEEFLHYGKKNPIEPKLPKPDDIFTICYTSGTTGVPKGVIMTHKNIMANHAALKSSLGCKFRDGGRVYSYLPPAHIFELMMQVGSVFHGRSIEYFSGNTDNFNQDVLRIKPHIIPLVPRIINRLYDEAIEEINSSFYKKLLLKPALKAKGKLLEKGIVSKSTLWDRLVFSELQKKLGGSQEIMIIGSAPTRKHVIEFFQRASGAILFERYGQSEGFGLATTLPYETEGGFVGAPTPAVHVKLIDAPEMNYFSKDGVGEICMKGDGVTPGYFKRPKTTEESKEGEWHKTGDIGKWLPNGYISLIDRKKHIFKLSQGVYIAPEKIETVYLHSSLVKNIYVDGFSEKDYVVAIVIPDKNNLMELAASKGFKNKSLEELCDMKEMRTEVLKDLIEIGKKENLNSLHQIKNLEFHIGELTVENNFLTPTLKFRRAHASKFFKSRLEAMYNEPPLLAK